MSRKTPWRDYKRAHWPAYSAFAEGRMSDYHAAVESRADRAREAVEQPSCCIFCHSLQVVTVEGFSFCPYERAGNHARAQQFNVEGWMNEQSRVVSAVPTRPRRSHSGDRVGGPGRVLAALSSARGK